MKGLKEKDSFLLKLGITVMAMLLLPLSQQAFAAGTTAGTDVINLATVDYEVNGNNQEDIESAPGVGNSVPGVGSGTATTFVVDNRVDFTLTQVGAVHTIVSPGDSDAFVEFLLTNAGNSAQDFRMTVAQLGSGDGAVNLLVDTDDDLNNLRIRVGNAGGVPVLGDLEYGDEIAEDASVTVYIFGDADVVLGLVNGDIANLELTATVAAAGVASSLGGDLADDVGNPDDPATVDVVFADGGALGDGIESDRDGFEVQSAGLNVSKIATVIDDPFNGTTNPKAIPGATVEYVITIINSGTLDADAISITDSIDTDVTFIADFYAGQDLAVVNDGTTITPCNADPTDTDTDGCALDGQDLTVGNANLAITVVAGTTLTVTYRVTIP
jgi:uncharacterized repeat protein (TIGR01451 family)